MSSSGQLNCVFFLPSEFSWKVTFFFFFFIEVGRSHFKHQNHQDRNSGTSLEILIQADKEISAFLCHHPVRVYKYTKPSLKVQGKKKGDKVQIKVIKNFL